MFSDEQLKPLISQYQRVREKFAAGFYNDAVKLFVNMCNSIQNNFPNAKPGKVIGDDELLTAIEEVLRKTAIGYFDTVMAEKLFNFVEYQQKTERNDALWEKRGAAVFFITTKMYNPISYITQNAQLNVKPSDTLAILETEYETALKQKESPEKTNEIARIEKRCVELVDAKPNDTLLQKYKMTNDLYARVRLRKLFEGNPDPFTVRRGNGLIKVMRAYRSMRGISTNAILTAVIENPSYAQAFFKRRMMTRFTARRDFRKEFARNFGVMEKLVTGGSDALRQVIRERNFLHSRHFNQSVRVYLEALNDPKNAFVVLDNPRNRAALTDNDVLVSKLLEHAKTMPFLDQAIKNAGVLGWREMVDATKVSDIKPIKINEALEDLGEKVAELSQEIIDEEEAVSRKKVLNTFDVFMMFEEWDKPTEVDKLFTDHRVLTVLMNDMALFKKIIERANLSLCQGMAVSQLMSLAPLKEIKQILEKKIQDQELNSYLNELEGITTTLDQTHCRTSLEKLSPELKAPTVEKFNESTRDSQCKQFPEPKEMNLFVERVGTAKSYIDYSKTFEQFDAVFTALFKLNEAEFQKVLQAKQAADAAVKTTPTFMHEPKVVERLPRAAIKAR